MAMTTMTAPRRISIEAMREVETGTALTGAAWIVVLILKNLGTEMRPYFRRRSEQKVSFRTREFRGTRGLKPESF